MCTLSEVISSYKKLSSEIKGYFEILKKGIYKKQTGSGLKFNYILILYKFVYDMLIFVKSKFL